MSQTSDAVRCRRAKELFSGALEMPASARGEWLGRQLAGDAGLAAEVEGLLALHGGSGLAMDAPPAVAVAAFLESGGAFGRRQPTSGSGLDYSIAQMTLSAGERLGPYAIVAAIGAGGMGEVYKARDTRLDRTVAIKVLPEHIAQREDLRARFELEARAVASLNHPHICTIHDIGNKEDGAGYMVMEFLEGETLAARIEKGAIPLDQALKFAAQIADALDRAHRAGVTHRDVKPGNIMLTRDGVKVLDFGLAKSSSKRAAPTGESTTVALTTEGTLMGTPQYMAPEQFEGREADARSDIWAFGAVLHEMVTGQKAFQGNSYASLNATIPAAGRAPMPAMSLTPPWLKRVVRRCLENDPEDRWQSMRDVTIELRTPPEESAAPSTGSNRWPWALASAMAAAALMLAIVHFRETGEQPRVFRMSVLPPDKAVISREDIPAIAPDGKKIAFVATADRKDQLWVRDLDSLTARALAGTEGAARPFWSPDSRTVAFWAGGKLKKADVAGGPVLTLCDAPSFRGGSWGSSRVIVFGGFGKGTFRVSAAGGSPTPVTIGTTDHRAPWFLPDGRHFLYTKTGLVRGEAMVYAADIDSKDEKLIVDVDSNAIYAAPGYLLFVRQRTLMAQPFDAGKLQTTGDAFPVAEEISAGLGAKLEKRFSASQNGVLAFIADGDKGMWQLTRFERSGKAVGTVGEPGLISSPAISPDGKTVAVDRVDPQTGVSDIWLHNVASGAASRFTFGPAANIGPVWSADGAYIAFTSSQDGIPHTFQRATSSPAARDEVLSKPLGDPPGVTIVADWSRDGRYLVFGVSDPKTKHDIWVLPLFGHRKAFPYLRTESEENQATISPDGRWLAYRSDESQRPEVYVQSFPGGGGRRQISSDGGAAPVWRKDGKELYYVDRDRVMAVEVTGGPKFEASAPKLLLEAFTLGGYDVGKDGRFLTPIPAGQRNPPITVVVNWLAGLQN